MKMLYGWFKKPGMAKDTKSTQEDYYITTHGAKSGDCWKGCEVIALPVRLNLKKLVGANGVCICYLICSWPLQYLVDEPVHPSACT